MSADPVFTEFCAAGLWPGLGRTLAGQLDAAGITTPADITTARLSSLPSVSGKRAERLLASWAGVAEAYAVTELLVPAGLVARQSVRVVEALGPGAAGRLRADPWRLLDVAEVRLIEADRLAQSLLDGQAQRDNPRRGRALVAHVLGRAARDGHTARPVETVLSAVAGQGGADPKAALTAALEGGAVMSFSAYDVADVPVGELLALERYAMAEDSVADGIARLLASAEPLGGVARGAVGKELDDAQRRAVEHALTHGVSLLTGGPGTGKSRTVAAVVALAQARNRTVALAAPTGRAAQRLEELAGAPAQTLHRLLGAMGTSGGFARGEAWPLDADVVVVDEASMLDAELAAALVEACADGTHLLLVGDPAQLPSIGAGRVLGDLVDAGVLPVTELATLYRQAEGGAIARLATAVRGGELPPSPTSPDREVVVVPAQSGGEAAHRAVQLVTDSIPRALGIAVAEVQVVTPVHRGPAGTVALNIALKAALNPGDGLVGGFDVGDRVVATANHLGQGDGAGFANGEVGVVTGTQDGGVVVAFAGGPVVVGAKSLPDLRHGWAVTVHRAQGSEWPAVVVVLPGEAGGMLSRPLVYTGLTRARRHLSVVHAAGPALARAVRDVGARPRQTRLRFLVGKAVSEATPGGKPF